MTDKGKTSHKKTIGIDAYEFRVETCEVNTEYYDVSMVRGLESYKGDTAIHLSVTARATDFTREDWANVMERIGLGSVWLVTDKRIDA